MRLFPVFMQDQLNDEIKDAFKEIAQSRPDARIIRL